jgi:nitroreductase
MKVSDAIKNRASVRAFKDEPVALDTICSVFENAARSPSGSNLQPWRMAILTPQKMTELNAVMEKRLSGEPHPDGDKQEYKIHPDRLKEPYRTSRYEVGEEMYALLGISREEKPKRLEWFANNFRFFGAPAAAFCFVDRIMGPPQWSDLGMYLQSVMLLFQEEGIDTCPQECWAMYPKTIHEFCEMPDELMLFCGMAIGYKDETHPVNKLRTKRLPASDWMKIL